MTLRKHIEIKIDKAVRKEELLRRFKEELDKEIPTDFIDSPHTINVHVNGQSRTEAERKDK